MISSRLRRRIAIALAPLSLMLFAACGSGSSSSSAAGNSYGTLTAGTIKFAYRTDDKPVSFVQDGKPAGFMVDLTTAMAAKLNMKADYVSTNFNSMLPDVRNHLYDAAAFGVLVTPDRKKQTAFTTAVNYSQAQVVSLKSAPIATVADCNGKTIAATQGSELISLLQATAPKVTVREFPNIASSANALAAKQVDGLLTGTTTTQTLLAQHGDFTASPPVTSGLSAFPVALDRPKLLQALNSALEQVIKDGTYTKLFAKWNAPGTEIPDQMLGDYPGMQQVPQASSSSTSPSASSASSASSTS
jgi:polar amino acid transport system substrate-binding protein